MNKWNVHFSIVSKKVFLTLLLSIILLNDVRKPDKQCSRNRKYRGDKSSIKTKDLITEVISIPVEERAIIVDSLLKSLNSPESDIDKKWAAVAKKRLSQLRSGEVQPVSGEEVFQRIWNRLSK
jgi:putative addiction module component (TIGR02574 family)